MCLLVPSVAVELQLNIPRCLFQVYHRNYLVNNDSIASLSFDYDLVHLVQNY